MLISIDKVRFKNFLSFGKKWQEFELKSGINCVTGFDNDKGISNGAGKTSFLEVFPFALFGQIHKNIKKSQILNWKNGKNCVVELDFRKGDVKYKVIRGIKPDIFEIYKDDVLIPKESNVKEYQKVLEEIINIDFQTFTHLVHTNINSSKPLLDISAGEKRKFLEQAFNLEIFTLIYQKAHEKSTILKTKLQTITFKVEKNTSDSLNGIERIRSLRSRIDEIDVDIKKLMTVTFVYEPEEEATHKEKIAKFNELQKIIQKKLDHKRNIKNKVEYKGKWYGSLVKKYKEEIALFKKNDIADANQKSIIEIQMEILDLDKDIKKYKNSIDKRSEEINLKNIELGNAKGLLKNVTETLNKIEDKTECPLCKQPIDKNTVIKTLKDRSLSFLEKIKAFKKEIDLLKRGLNDRNKSVYKFIDDKQKLEKLKTKIENYSNKVDSILAKGYKLHKYKKVMSKLRTCYQKIDLTKIEETMKTGETSLIKLEVSLRKYMDERIEYEKTQVTIKSKEGQKCDYIEMINKEKNLLENIKEMNKKLNIENKKYNTLNDYLSYMKTLCGDANLKQYTISSFMPYLNKQVNEYIQNIGFGFNIILDKWMNIEIKGAGIRKASYGNLSGGEKKSIDLALQLSLMDITRLQAKNILDLLIFDELLDGSIDSVVLQNLLSLIQIRQKKDNSKLFIVSHRKDLDIENVNNYIVEKSNGFSVLT